MVQAFGLPGPDWARAMSTLEDADIKARLRALPAEQQAELFLSLDWGERLRLVRLSDAAAELVGALPEEEVLLTIKGAGEEDSLPLVALTTGPQLQFILDLELWQRSSFDGTAAQRWLHYILICGEQKIMQLAESTDQELFVLMLSNLMTLVPNEEGIEPPEGLASIMPDEFFTILSDVPAEAENLRLLLRILRQWNRDRYYRLLFQIYGCTGAEVEESALRWRNSRLEEKGLLDFDEAVEIYSYVSEEEARELGREAPEVFHKAASPEPAAPIYPILFAESRTLFYETLTSIEDGSLRNRLRSEIAFAANRLLVADSERIGEIASMKNAVRHLFALVNVGLAFLSGGDRAEARRMIEDVPIKELFQIGFSRAADLRTAARDIVRRWWPGWREDGFVFLWLPEDEVIRGLMQRVPLYYDPAESRGSFRDFRSMDDIHETGEILEEVAVVAETCFDKLGIPKPHEAKPALEHVFTTGIEEITLRNLLLTGFMNFSLNGRFEIEPLTRRDVEGIFEKVLEQVASGERLVREDAKTEFLAWLGKTTGFDGKKWVVLSRIFADCVKSLNEEVCRIPSWDVLDPRYVSMLVFGTWSAQDER